jgi:hypothetical protein
MVRHPEGRLLDVDGLHDVVDIEERYAAEADGDEAVAAVSTRADATEWYVECQGEPIPIRLAASFIDAVLARIVPQAEPADILEGRLELRRESASHANEPA